MREPIEDLVQRVLDGSATAEERSRLDALTAADPALRRRREELEHVFSLLGSARLAPAPEGLRDSVLQAIADLPTASRPRAPQPAIVDPRRAGWFRIAIPVAAVIAAAVLVWAVRIPSSGSRAGWSGTMAGTPRPVYVSLGVGPAAMIIVGRPAETGFELELRAGSVPGVVEITPLEDGIVLSRSPQVTGDGSRQLSVEFEPDSRQLAHGHSAAPEVPLRIVVRFADGREASAVCRVPARRARGPGG